MQKVMYSDAINAERRKRRGGGGSGGGGKDVR